MRGKSLTDLVSEYKAENILEFKKLLSLINKNKIKEIKPKDLLILKKEHKLNLTDDELFSFLNRISENDVEGLFAINFDLFHRSFDRLSQQLKLINPYQLKPDVNLSEKELIDYITEMESNDEGFLIARNITKDIYKSFEEFIKNLDDFLGNTPINDQISMEIDDIKSKLKEIEVYINEFSSKSVEKYQKLIMLKDYLQKLENNIKYYEDTNNSMEKEADKSKTYETVEEYNKLLDDHHNINNKLQHLNLENKELLEKYYKKEKEVFDLQDHFNNEINNLKLEKDDLEKQNNEFKLQIESLLENKNLNLNFKENENENENDLSVNGQPHTTRNMRLFSVDDEFDLISPNHNLLERKTTFQEIYQVMNSHKNENPIFKGMNEDQKKYIVNLESVNKSLSEKLTSLEKSQSLYEQKIFILNKEIERFKERSEKIDLAKTISAKNSMCQPSNPLADLSAIGNESLMIINEANSPKSKVKHFSFLEHEDKETGHINFNLNLKNLNNLNSDDDDNDKSMEFEGQFNTKKILKRYLDNTNEIARLNSISNKEEPTPRFSKFQTKTSEETLETQDVPVIKNIRSYTTFKNKSTSNFQENQFSLQILSNQSLKVEVENNDNNNITFTDNKDKKTELSSEPSEIKPPKQRLSTNSVNFEDNDLSLNRSNSVTIDLRNSDTSIQESNPHYSSYDYIELEYDNDIIKLIEKNKEKVNEIKIFSDNIFVYDNNLRKITSSYLTLLITNNYIYVLESTKYLIRIVFNLKDLYKISISSKNCNLICLRFYDNVDFMFDSYRRMHLLHYFRDLCVLKRLGKLLFKSSENIDLTLSNKDYTYVPTSAGLNFTSCSKIGYLDKYHLGFLKNSFQEKYVVLSSIGLLCFDSPGTRPEIISLVGTEVQQVFDEKKYKRKYCFEIMIRDNNEIVVFGSKNNVVVLSWIKEIMKVKRIFNRKVKTIQNICS